MPGGLSIFRGKESLQTETPTSDFPGLFGMTVDFFIDFCYCVGEPGKRAARWGYGYEKGQQSIRNRLCAACGGALRAEHTPFQGFYGACAAHLHGGIPVSGRGSWRWDSVSVPLAGRKTVGKAYQTGSALRHRHDSSGYWGAGFPDDRDQPGHRFQCFPAGQF